MPRIVSADCPEGAIDSAVSALKRGQLVVFPTDTVYGVGAAVNRPDGVAKLYVAKGRPLDRAIPVLVSSLDAARHLSTAIPAAAESLMQLFWPGPLTIVVPAAEWLPGEIVRDTGCVGLRMPDHSIALRLIARTSGALAVTSANRSGEPESCFAQGAADALGDRVEVVIDGGRTPGGIPSTVVKVETDNSWSILRAGAVTQEALSAALASN